MVSRRVEQQDQGRRTVLNVAVLDLLQHLGPHRGVNLLVLGYEFGLQLDDLGEPTAEIPGSRVLPGSRRCGRICRASGTPQLRHGEGEGINICEYESGSDEG